LVLKEFYFLEADKLQENNNTTSPNKNVDTPKGKEENTEKPKGSRRLLKGSGTKKGAEKEKEKEKEKEVEYKIPDSSLVSARMVSAPPPFPWEEQPIAKRRVVKSNSKKISDITVS